MIAIDGNTKLVYEGQSFYGYGLWPTPVLSLATVIANAASLIRLPAGSDLLHADMVFREDSFDPVTRIRRGRLYKTPGSQPQEWHVTPHSFLPSQALTQVRLHGFDSNFMAGIRGSVGDSLIALGTRDAFTLWRVVDIERIVTGEDLLTLRARGSLGLLPELNEASVPPDARGKVMETLSKLSEAAYRAGPESIVDRARDVAQWTIGCWLGAQNRDAKLRLVDLWELAGKVSEAESAVVRSVGRSLARLHARNKPNVQAEQNTRPVTEDDAEYALAAVGMLLREVGWAK
jgi:hypothetical protein